MSSSATRRIQKELSELVRTPLEGVTVKPNGDDLHHWSVTMAGPAGTPYNQGAFKLKVAFGAEFPFKAPAITFATKMYHPNIDSDGNICIGVLKPDVWKPATKMSNVLLAIYDLIESPNPDDPLVSSIAEQYTNDRKAFDKKAADYTRRYAM